MHYKNQIRERIAKVLARGPRTLGEILRSCRGAYPTIVAECLTELKCVEKKRGDLFALQETRDELDREALSFSVSHVEGNPVLCSWYFTAGTCAKVEKLRSWSASRLVFLGAPMLYEWFCHRQVGVARTLLELDQVIVDNLLGAVNPLAERVCRYDTADELPADLLGHADVVFLDPPWYPECYDLWLRRVAQIAPGGTVFLPLFPELTRPAAATQREELLARLKSCSSELFVLEDFVEYVIPTFEQPFLEHFDLHDLGSWKMADFLIVELLDDASIEQAFPLPEFPDRRRSWIEVDVKTMRFFVDTSASIPGAGVLSLPANGHLFASPSRRDPEREILNVLTSRGHGLSSSEPMRLVDQLAKISAEAASGRLIADIVGAADLEADLKILFLDILPKDEPKRGNNP